MTNSFPAWTADDVLALGREYQRSAVLLAAAELDLFSYLARRPASAELLARDLQCDPRAMTLLADALAALQLFEKRGDHYHLPEGLAPFLTAGSPRTVLAMAQHQANCLRNWAQLAMTVKTGQPAPDIPSVRGESGDQEAFIEAMHNVSAPVADEVIRAIQPLEFTHLLDIGGASGTWTAAFLRACPGASATIFDLPQVVPMAQNRLEATGLLHRVRLVAGSFYEHELPAGADLVWLSAIIHQNSRAQNRDLFRKIFHALKPGGRLAIRDVVMEPGRTEPVAGALFAINMLVATPGGGTFTLEELEADLQAGGFQQAALVRHDPGMNAIVVAQ